jgi:hypothetical protein
MPLISIPAQQAVENRKTNPNTYWGNRSLNNRVEPIALPEFYPSFNLKPGESIFTIGSCFARHVEDELMKRGFRTPVRELMKDPLFADLETGVLNNYGTPSIYHELAWAFEADRPFVPKEHLLEVKPGKFIDIHLPPTVAAADWETVVARRKAIRKLTRAAADCRVVIITLGLAEVWFDTVTGYYLNDVLRPALVRLHPSRFELHVLSYEEAYGFLEKALLLLKNRGRKDLRVVLTVSPVPLMATHRPMDVMVANTYSKSVLRAAADAVCAKYDWIDYFPSFESVMLSDRKVAWEADLIHVTNDMVALNVGRMLDRYVSNAEDVDGVRARMISGGRLVAENMARSARERGGDYARAFFAEFASWAEQSAAFALEQATYLHAQFEDSEALEILNKAPAHDDPFAFRLLKAQVLLRLARPAEAIEALEPLTHQTLRSQPTWELLVRAYAENRDPEGAIATTQRYMSIMGYARSWAFLNLARALRAVDPARSLHFYELIADDFLDTDQWIQYEIADILAQNRKFDLAQRLLDNIRPTNADLEGKIALLNSLLRASLANGSSR